MLQKTEREVVRELEQLTEYIKQLHSNLDWIKRKRWNRSLPLEELLFPYITEVTFTPDMLSMAAGGSVTYVDVAVEMSNLQVLEFTDFGAFLEFDTDNHDVALAVWNGSTGKLAVTSVGAGTTSVIVSRRKGTVTPRLPVVPPLTNTISITVT